jgi:hypothetical protein
VDTDNNPDTPPVSVYGYWADVGGQQALIVCDPQTGEPVLDQDGNGIAYLNNGQYVETETEILDRYDTKQILDWDNPKQVQPFQVSVFAPNVPLTLTYNLQDINAHGGLWLHSTGDCVSWGYSAGDAKLLTNNPDDWLIVAAVTNPNPFPASGEVDLTLYGKLSWNGSTPLRKNLTLRLGPDETKYVLINRGNATDYYGIFAYKASSMENGSYRQGYSLGHFYSRRVSGSGDDFPDRLKPAKGFYLADPNWRIYPDKAWPMRFGVYLNAATYVAIYPNWSTYSDGFKGYVWMDQEGKFRVQPGYTVYPYRLTEQQIVARVENWFNSHKITDIPLVCWYGGDSRTVDGLQFDYCRPIAYWWPDTWGAYASWFEFKGPELEAPRWEPFEWAPWWPRVAQWVPAREGNIDTRYWVGERTVWHGPEVPPWLPVVKARLCFVHRYSWVPMDGDTGVLKEDVVPGYQMWVSSVGAPHLYFNNPLKKITAVRYRFLRYQGGNDHSVWLVTTWKYTPDTGWVKASEYERDFGWWDNAPPYTTWGRYAFFVRAPGWQGSGAGVIPDVWDVRADYPRVLSVNNPDGLTGAFTGTNSGNVSLYDRGADAIRGALYNTYNIWYGSGPYGSNNTPAVADLNTPNAGVTVPSIKVNARTATPVWQQDCAASVRVARNPYEAPDTALNTFLSAVQRGLGSTEAVFIWDWNKPQFFVLDPDIPCGWAADAGGKVQPVTWVKGFGSVYWNSTGCTLGTPESLWSRYSYFHMEYVALPGDVFLNQAANTRSWTIRPSNHYWSNNWPFIDPWPVRYWSGGSWHFQE